MYGKPMRKTPFLCQTEKKGKLFPFQKAKNTPQAAGMATCGAIFISDSVIVQQGFIEFAVIRAVLRGKGHGLPRVAVQLAGEHILQVVSSEYRSLVWQLRRLQSLRRTHKFSNSINQKDSPRTVLFCLLFTVEQGTVSCYAFGQFLLTSFEKCVK